MVEIRTFNGEVVKSFGEKHVADYLAMHGIDYVYEDRYGIGDYRPDFHIAGSDVWIEFWGIGRNGKVPSWFDGAGLDPSVAYRESMEWKRKVHKERGTGLIEVYSYQKSDGTLDRELSRQLKQFGVRGSRIKSIINRARMWLSDSTYLTANSTAWRASARRCRSKHKRLI